MSGVDRDPVLHLEKKFVALEAQIKERLLFDCDDPDSRIRIEGVHYTKIVSDEAQGGSSALRLDINGQWNSFPCSLSKVLHEYASIVDAGYKAIEDGEQSQIDQELEQECEEERRLNQSIMEKLRAGQKEAFTSDEKKKYDVDVAKGEEIRLRYLLLKNTYVTNNRQRLLEGLVGSMEIAYRRLLEGEQVSS